MQFTGSLLEQAVDQPSGGRWGASPWQVGSGTAWEDRGEVGVGRAFLVTLMQGVVSPGHLLASIRRGEGRDTVGLVLFYAGFWAVSVVVHAALLLVQYRRRGDLEVVETAYWQAAGVLAAGVVLAAGPGFAAMARTFGRLVRFDMPRPAPPAMMFNVLAYCLAPSVVAPVPYLGPVVAAGWIFWLWVMGTRAKFRANTAGAVIAATLTMVATIVVVVGAYWAASFAYVHLVGSPIDVIEVVKMRHG